MDRQLNAFKAFIQTIPETHSETTRWELRDGIVFEKGEMFDPENYMDDFLVVLRYFKEWQKFADLEAQVLLVTTEDYDKHYTHFPTLANPKSTQNLKIVVLPQINTTSNTIIEDGYWYKTVKGQPIMRIHSHHRWNAYQSQTDFNYLNSGTLEVVFGQIEQDEPKLAYWLSRHSDIHAKENVFYSTIKLEKAGK